jgi:hypothetical protein
MASGEDQLEQLLTGIPRAREPLLRELISRLDDSMIVEIAAADYGDDAAINEAALREIIEAADVRSPLEWNPGEVLELVRWSRPEDDHWAPGGHGHRGHVMRAFCCAVLLHDPSYGGGGTNQSVARLIESAVALGDQILPHVLPFLNWFLHKHDEERDERIFIVLGMLMLLAHEGGGLAHGRLHELANWIEAEDQSIRDAGEAAGPRPLWDLTSFTLSHDIWGRLIRQFMISQESPAEIRGLGMRLLKS